MNIQEYIHHITLLFASGNATEHSYRGYLQQLLSSLLESEGITVTNEPKRIECGAPDYILTKKNVPIGYIEAKDVGADLDSKIHKAQFDRYKAALDNLIITDYLNFQFFRNGELVNSICIADININISNKKITGQPENFARFTALIENFAQQLTQSIQSPAMLAQMMAAKARLMAKIIHNALDEDDKKQVIFEKASDLQEQKSAFKDILIHDIDNPAFADIYAQTIVYGLFAARYHDGKIENIESSEPFSRQKAATLIPQSNPFLRKLFQYIAGYDLDDRLVWLVEELVEIFLATDMARVMQNFGKSTSQNDPIIHFYETFLAEYDPKLRKARGVWYTPEPVVNFIVRAVDDVLKTHFNLPQGLADTSKIKQTLKVQDAGKNGKSEKITKAIHKVQILDPATGTGTFLAETIRHIYDEQFSGMQGTWAAYVKNHLIPRLNGFELLMTSYAMAHLKLDMLLTETGYSTSNSRERLRIYLTNSLEEHHPDTNTIFASWLSAEANEANHIKRDVPVMVVMGNPPYSVSSSNKGDWIQSLLQDYKKGLNERNIQPLSDDYIKFIRFGQHFIDKNGEGVLAYISNNSFIDGLIHRQMRKSLLESFEAIYILDLHGNTTKREKSPDGSKDENVFDIRQGVSINIFIKTKNKIPEQLAEVFHHSLHGKRSEKYAALKSNTLNSIPWEKINYQSPEFFFVQKNNDAEAAYKQGFSVNDLFIIGSSGIKTHRDHFVIDKDEEQLIRRIKRFYDLGIGEFQIKSELNLKDNRDWNVSESRRKGKFNSSYIKEVTYRPFDNQKIYYDSNVIDFDKKNVMNNLLNGDNFALCCLRQARSAEQGTFFISNNLVIKDAVSLLDTCTVYPLYIIGKTYRKTTRTPNLRQDIVDAVSAIVVGQVFTPIDLLDYIYAVLHSPTYRKTYQEFLKIDFPRIPYPQDAAQFWQLVALGGQLRQWHLLEGKGVSAKTHPINYPITGDHEIDKIRYDNGKVYINANQYFSGIPELTWNFYIGGYQPAQKWLKDRKGSKLEFEDVLHYRKIINALIETEKIMQQIDEVTKEKYE
ncbi:MAG: hypothetical protein RIR79_951 [Pseudomonadota bacterium]|jgi:hypothetical protein